MSIPRIARRLLLAISVPLIVSCVGMQQQTGDKEREPEIGQAGKDVMWLPTPQPLVEKMLDLARLTPDDYLIDLGSGDGRTVISAAKRGTRALGIEYDPGLVELARRNAEKEGLSDLASFIDADIFASDMSRATVITMFLLTDLNLKLRPKILGLKPGTRIVSNTFKMDDWEPDGSATTGCGSFCTAYLWIVPASVEGTWQSANGELKLTQHFQTISGALKFAGATVPITNAQLSGDRIRFDARGAHYTGRAGPDGIEGLVSVGTRADRWRAVRAANP